MPESGETILEVRAVSKAFAGTRALECVDLDLRSGEVHALVGENGAGKSTLMNILVGLVPPDQGEILLRGRRLPRHTPQGALRAGISMIHQELLPFREMTVAENIAMGREPICRFPGWVDRSVMNRQSAELLQRLGLDLPPGRKMKELRVAEWQVVEIAKAIAWEARVIIMDEPTSALSERETERLIEVIGDLKRLGVAIIYISHKLEEVFQLADRITVLRDGRRILTEEARSLDEKSLIRLMVGRDVPPRIRKGSPPKGQEILRTEGLSRKGAFRNISFRLREGEILGIAGLMGAGRTELVRVLFGLETPSAGEIRVQGRKVAFRHPGEALAGGIALVPEDRKSSGFIPALSVQHNLTLTNLQRFCRFGGWIDRTREEQAAAGQCRTFSIGCGGLGRPVRLLSGGNQQKVVVAKAMLKEPLVLLLDEPTRGIDIGARQDMYETILRFASQGMAILMVSSDLPEILSLSDRVLVMRQGTLAAEMETANTTAEEILHYAMPVGA